VLDCGKLCGHVPRMILDISLVLFAADVAAKRVDVLEVGDERGIMVVRSTSNVLAERKRQDLPKLREGDVVILDNLSSHKAPAAAAALRAIGAWFLFRCSEKTPHRRLF